MKRLATAALIAGLILSVGCVIRTEHKIDAHITLDIRHIQEQANQVLDYIEGKTDELPGLAAEPAPAAGSDSTSWVRRALDALSPMQVAYAQENLKTESPLVTQIAQSLRDRNDKIQALKKDGCLGENNRGYVELGTCAALDDAAKKNEIQQLLADENKDRKALYKEVARLNEAEGVSVSTIESVYANQRLKRAAAGESVQLPPAGEMFEAFKASPAGQRLGAECQPGAWVTMK